SHVSFPVCFFTTRHPPSSTLFPYTTLFRSIYLRRNSDLGSYFERENWRAWTAAFATSGLTLVSDSTFAVRPFLPSDTISYAANTDRKSTRLNSSHVASSYAVFCLKKKKRTK